MSVLLTASKKAVKGKGCKAKRKKETRPARKQFDPTPPVSSHSTTVWHWELDGLATTVMFNKDRRTIWCDGAELVILPKFPKDEEGVIFQFNIREHSATILGKMEGKKMVYKLDLGGCQILEHTANSATTYSLPGVNGAGMVPQAACYTDPPAYDSVKKYK